MTQLVRAAGLMVRANVNGAQAEFPADFEAVANHLVGGAFVSLKRGGHLRSCCGLLGQPPGLEADGALAEAAVVDDSLCLVDAALGVDGLRHADRPLSFAPGAPSVTASSKHTGK